MVGTEQRRETRVGYRTQAVVACGGTRHSTRTINLSKGGIRVLAPPRIALGNHTEVEVQLTFSWTSEWVRIPAQVVYEHCEDGLRYWGLRFRSLPKDARILISLFVNGQAERAPSVAPRRESSATRKPTPPPRRSKSSIRGLIEEVVQYLHEEEPFRPKGKKVGR